MKITEKGYDTLPPPAYGGDDAMAVQPDLTRAEADALIERIARRVRVWGKKKKPLVTMLHTDALFLQREVSLRKAARHNDVEKLVTDIETRFARFLSEDGLPTRNCFYLYDPDKKKWCVLDENGPPDGWEGGFHQTDLVGLIIALGFDCDGVEVATAQFIREIDLIRRLRARGETDAGAIALWRLGAMMMEFEKVRLWKVGKSVEQGGVKGTDTKWGAPQERVKKQERRKALFYVERLKCMTDEEAYEAVAQREGVSPHTIRRAVKGH